MRARFFVAVVLIAFLFIPLAVFAGGRAEEAPDEDGVIEIRMWFGRENFIPDDRFETFHAENPNIRVNFDVIPLEQAVTEFIPAYGTNDAPHVLQIGHQNYLPLVSQNMLKDIGRLINRWQNEDPDDFAEISPFAFDLATWEGKTYGMSMWGGPRFHVYRTDVFAEHGLDAPETWEDVLEAARVTNGPNMLGMSIHGSRAHSPWGWFGSKFMSMGGEFVDGVMQIDSEAGIYALEFYQTLAREGLIDDDVLALRSGDFRAAFIDGRAAQFFEAANLYATLNQNLEYGEQWAPVIQPYREGARDERTIAGDGWPFLVSNQVSDAELDAIYEVFRYVSQRSGEVAIRYQPPTRMTVFDDPEFRAAQPWWDDIKDVYDTMVMFPFHPRTPDMAQIVLDAKQWALGNPNGNVRDMVGGWQAELDEIAARTR